MLQHEYAWYRRLQNSERRLFAITVHPTKVRNVILRGAPRTDVYLTSISNNA